MSGLLGPAPNQEDKMPTDLAQSKNGRYGKKTEHMYQDIIVQRGQGEDLVSLIHDDQVLIRESEVKLRCN